MAGKPPLLEEDAEAAWELFVLGVEEPPAHGDAENAAWFRASLQELGFTQGSFARRMQRRGDTRSKRNVLRSIQRMSAGRARVPGEMRVLLGLMLRSKQRKTARLARERDERDAPWNDPPETHDGQGERDGRDAPRSDLSETRGRAEEPDGPDAAPDHSSETRSGQERPNASEAPVPHPSAARPGPGVRGTGAAPQGHSSETRHGRAEPDGFEALGDDASGKPSKEEADGLEEARGASPEARAGEQRPRGEATGR